MKDAMSARKGVPPALALGGELADSDNQNTLGSPVGDVEINMHAVL